MLRLNDIRLKGCGFTLFPACREYNVPEDIVYSILVAIHAQLNGICNDLNLQTIIKDINPAYPTVLSFNAISDGFCIAKAEQNDLLEEVANGYKLTQKLISIFKRAAEIQSQLDNAEFTQ